MRLLFIVSLIAIVASCVTRVRPEATGGAPSAVLACPTQVDVGAAFTIDGSASVDVDGVIVEHTLTVVPGDHVIDGLRGDFVIARATIATAVLVLVDDEGNSAEARCRFSVGSVGDDVPGVDDVGDDDDVGDVGERVDLTGTFAMVAYDLPELTGGGLLSVMSPARQCATAPSLSLVTLTHSGRDVDMTMKTCTLTMPTVNTIFGAQETTAPTALIDALPALRGRARLAGSKVGDVFSIDEVGVGLTVGAAVNDSDDLPADGGDARVRDDDGDGRPGVTLRSTSGEQDIVYRRFIDALDGVVVSADEIDGTTPGSYMATGQSSLLSFLDFLVPTGAGLPSTFKMVRIDADSCDDVRARAAELLARLPPPALPDGCPAF